MSIKEQYYNFIWEVAKKGLDKDDKDSIISLNAYNRLLKHYLEKYKAKDFFDLPFVYRYYLSLQSFLLSTINTILELLHEQQKEMKGFYQQLIELLDELKRDVIQEEKEYETDKYQYKVSLVLIEILRATINSITTKLIDAIGEME
ncbi:MAG: hypothetical protein F7B11_01000 [Caldisphaeraceae archaeon]|nr:hypothetical protein [Caldisphaeraceae archaeon]